MVSRSEEEVVGCPVHEPAECPGEEGGCAALLRSRLLDDRLLAIRVSLFRRVNFEIPSE